MHDIVNKIQLIGRVGGDPTVTDVGDERRVVNYSLATSETHPDKEGKQSLRFRYLELTRSLLPRELDKEDTMAPHCLLEFS